MDYIRIFSIAEKQIPAKRFAHSLRVADMMILLNNRFSFSTENDARVAALWHDYARDWSNRDIIEIIAENTGIDTEPGELENPMLLHGAASALMLKRAIEPSIITPGLFSAIRWHTAGSVKMGQLGYALYIADYAELGRTHLSNEERENILQLESMEYMVLSILEKIFRHLREIGKTPLQSSVKLYETLKDRYGY